MTIETLMFACANLKIKETTFIVYSNFGDFLSGYNPIDQGKLGELKKETWTTPVNYFYITEDSNTCFVCLEVTNNAK